MFVTVPGVGLNRGVGLYRATSRDAGTLTSSQVQTFQHDQPPGWGAVYSSVSWNRKMIGDALYYEITLDGQVVGGLIVVRGSWEHFHIVRIWVEPGFQRRGIGSRALALLETSHRQASLWTAEVPAWADRRELFFKRNGYDVTCVAHDTVHLAKQRPGVLRLRSLP